jgi:hypothetical protein
MLSMKNREPRADRRLPTNRGLYRYHHLAWCTLSLRIDLRLVRESQDGKAVSDFWRLSPLLSVQLSSSLNAIAAQKKEAAELAARMARDEADRQRYLAQQNKIGDQILSANEESITAFERVPLQLQSAENFLDQAESDYVEGAFAPFWDSVEKAALALAGFDEGVRKIEGNSKNYIDLVTQYRGKTPVFAVSPSSVPSLALASETSKRMNGIVRKAQRNFEFSVIYEQRKTNQILVAGFRNLAQALEEMTWRITSSLDDLRNSVDGMHSSLNASLSRIHEQTERIAAATEGYRADFARESVGRGAREQKVLEMLDNIQRKRYPSFLHGGLR